VADRGTTLDSLGQRFTKYEKLGGGNTREMILGRIDNYWYSLPYLPTVAYFFNNLAIALVCLRVDFYLHPFPCLEDLFCLVHALHGASVEACL
jgi:hypothetical protein